MYGKVVIGCVVVVGIVVGVWTGCIISSGSNFGSFFLRGAGVFLGLVAGVSSVDVSGSFCLSFSLSFSNSSSSSVFCRVIQSIFECSSFATFSALGFLVRFTFSTVAIFKGD